MIPSTRPAAGACTAMTTRARAVARRTTFVRALALACVACSALSACNGSNDDPATGAAAAGASDDKSMSFFVTSEGGPSGANLGGLDGADALCQQRATAVGAGNRTWHAYLSTQATPSAPAVNARDRIGTGPWHNARGDVIAVSVADLHGASNQLSKSESIDEAGRIVNGRGDTPNRHDILTGSQADGTAFAPGQDRTCSNWTSDGAGAAMVGHHDRQGTGDPATAGSWNSAHPTQGCVAPTLAATGGAGLLYCFAVR